MTFNESKNKDQELYDLFDEEDANYIDFLGILKRKYKLILGCFLTSAVFSAVYSLTIKPTYEGEFQIVLQKPEGESMLGASEFGGLVQRVAGDRGRGSDMRTQVAILKSPLVMNPVFNLSKIQNASNKADESKIRFREWIDSNFNIELIEKTYILNVAYRSQNKSHILPILNLVSEEYQKYSGRERNMGLESGITFLKNQIKLKKIDSEKSMSELQSFSFEHNLGTRDGMIPSTTETEFSSSSAISNYSQDLASQRYQSQFSLLDSLETEVVTKSAFYKENSDEIRILKQKINIIKESLKRPKEILMQHKELSRKALRDEATLVSLENQLSSMQLEQAKKSPPWELISTPTVSDIQVAPKKKAIVRFWGIVGLITGLLGSIIIETKSGVIYSEQKLKKLIKLKYLKSIKLDDSSSSEDFSQLRNFFNKFPDNNICFLYLKNDPKDNYELFIKSIFENQKLNKKIELKNELSLLDKKMLTFLLIDPKSATSYEIKDLLENISLYQIEIYGWFILN